MFDADNAASEDCGDSGQDIAAGGKRDAGSVSGVIMESTGAEIEPQTSQVRGAAVDCGQRHGDGER
jgi:hypothetical protein